MAARKPSLRESYDILGLPESADEDEVRKSYKLKARECHPDKNPNDPEATRKFQELGEAYHRIQSGNDDEDDFSAGIDPFVVFLHVMRMQQFMRNIFHAQFADSDDEDDFAFAAFGGRFFRFSRPPADDFERRRSQYSDQSGRSRFRPSSWRYDQQSRAREEPSFRRANMSATEGFPRTRKHKKYQPRYDYDSPNMGDRSSKGEGTRCSTPRGRSKPSGNQRFASKESFDVEDTSVPVYTPRAKPNPFPQVKPKKKSKKQQRYEEWKRQKEVAENVQKEEDIKEEVRGQGTSNVNAEEQAFQEREDISEKGGLPVADPSPMTQQEVKAGDSDTVVTDNGSSQKKNPNETTAHDTPLKSQKNRPTHYGNTDTSSCKQIRKDYHDDGEGRKVGNDKQTKQTQNEGDEEKQRQITEEDDLCDVDDDTFKPCDKPGVVGPAANGRNQRRNRNRRKKAKEIAKEAELKPDVLQSKKEMEKQEETRKAACVNKTQNSEQGESREKSAGDSEALHSRTQGQRRQYPKKKVGIDAEKPIKMPQNETGKQKETKDAVAGKQVNPTNNVKLHERIQSSCPPEQHDLFGEDKFGVNMDGQVKSTPKSNTGETKYSKAERPKPRKAKQYRVHDFPSSPSYHTHSKHKDYDHQNERKSSKGIANERGPMDTIQQQSVRAFPKPEKRHVYEPQMYRKPPIENNHDNDTWTTGNKRKARRDRKWLAAQHRCPTYTDTSASPETTNFWDSVMPTVERQSVSSLAPTDELDEQRQLEIALELSKRQF